jgi:hypothetical protein
MRSVDEVASWSGEISPNRLAARRRVLVGGILIVAAMWSLALLPQGTAKSGANPGNSGEKDFTPTLAAFPQGEPIAVAVTPEWEPLVRRIGKDLVTADPKIRFYVHTVSAEKGFAELAQSKVLAVVAPRLMTSAETLRLSSYNYSIVQASLMLDNRHLYRPYPSISSDPPTEKEFLFLYMRGEAWSSRPGLQAFRRRFIPEILQSYSVPAQRASADQLIVSVGQ